MDRIAMDDKAERNNKVLALVGTLLVHGLLFLLFILMVFKTPLPPYPEGGTPGIEIDFGNMIEGTGQTEASGIGDSKPNPKDVIQTSASPSQQNEDSYVTNDAEESISLTKPVKKKKQQKKEEVVSKVETKTEPTPIPSNELLGALNKLKSSSSAIGGDGNSGKAGNKGDPNGSLDGDGSGGWGGGSGKYYLKGRKLLERPAIVDDSQEEGKVVVDIVVDENGKVIRANPGVRGSTTTSAMLYAKARQAALTAKFNANFEGIKEQRGTITFVFTLD